MDGLWYSFADELTSEEETFFAMVEMCDLPAVEQFLTVNQVNINMKNYQGITPLHLAIQNDCAPLVELFLRQKDIRIGDSALFAITHDNIRLLGRLLDYEQQNGSDGGKTKDGDGDSDEFPSFMTPLMLAAQCGRYEMVEYLLARGHKLKRPHPPRCECEEQCSAAAARDRDEVAYGCERLNTYRAISDPTYICCTSADDPTLVCFQLHEELLECGSIDRMYTSKYRFMAQQVRQFAVELVYNCRTSDEVKTLLQNRNGCEFRGRFPYPRLMTAMDKKQKEFVAHTNVQQVLESVWIGDWIEWKSFSSFHQCLYPVWRFIMLPLTIALGVLVPDLAWNQSNRLPINRMYNGLVTYLAFLALLFVQSNSDKYQMVRGAPVTVTWVLTAVFVLGHAVEKIKLRMLQGPERYFGNPWNVFDTVKLTLFVTAYLCWIAAKIQLHWVDGELDRRFWHWADPQLVAEGLFAVATVMAYLRLLFLCQINYYVGPMQVSLGKMLRDFGKFTTFLVIIMMAFTSGLGTLYAYYAGMVRKDPETGQTTRQEDSFVTLGDTFKTLFWGIFCMTSLDAPNVVVENSGGDMTLDVQPHYFTQLVGYGLFAVFEVLMVIVMLNMLIAAMSDTFQRVADNAEYEWLFGRTEVYINYMLMNDLPPPFNLLPTTRLLVRLLKWTSTVADSPYGPLEDVDHAEFRALTTELVKRYFTHKNQMDVDMFENA